MYKARVLILLILFTFTACPSGGGRSRVIVCGGGANFGCPRGMFCDLSDNCGGIDREGVCRVIPESCPVEDLPSCGCDGTTHASPCYANAQGVAVAYDGPCLDASQFK